MIWQSGRWFPYSDCHSLKQSVVRFNDKKCFGAAQKEQKLTQSCSEESRKILQNGLSPGLTRQDAFGNVMGGNVIRHSASGLQPSHCQLIL